MLVSVNLTQLAANAQNIRLQTATCAPCAMVHSRKTNMKHGIRGFLLTNGLTIGLCFGAHANPVPAMSLEVFEGMPGSTVLVDSAGPASTGSLMFNSTTIPNFTLVSASVTGFPIVPQADLAAGSIEVTTSSITGTRELKILITQNNLDAINIPTDFQTSTAANFLIGASQIKGVTLSAYIDTANVDFGTPTLIQSDMYAMMGSSGAINHTLSSVAGPFSETFVIDAQFTGGAAATLFPSIILKTVPIAEPGTLALLGMALTGFSVIRRCRRTV
jgi:hypothetical protein